MDAESNEVLKQRILRHCRSMYEADPAYASWAFDRYTALLPWVGLERKR